MSDENVTASVQEVEPEDVEITFQWMTEGLLLFITSCIGLVGNTCSVITCSRQRVQRVFHRLLLVLATFDTVSQILT